MNRWDERTRWEPVANFFCGLAVIVLMVFGIILVLAGCSPSEKVFEGEIVGYENNMAPSIWSCAAERFTIVRWDGGEVGDLCGWRGNVGERVKVTRMVIP